MQNSNWELLTTYEEQAFGHGTVFRCPAEYPYEKLVDFLLINYPDGPARHALIVATGQKAGHVLIILPAEAKDPVYFGISVRWLKENWKKWIYEIGPEQVYLKRRYTLDPKWIPEKV